MSKRTFIRFRHGSDIWPIVEEWASKHGYKLKNTAENERTYQKGIGLLVAPMMFRIMRKGSETAIEAWIRGITFVRIRTFFIIPREMGIESGGIRGALPRRIARNAVNNLLTQLERPLIP